MLRADWPLLKELATTQHRPRALATIAALTGGEKMLDPAELIATADAFGVAETQVKRDHLISHVLVALDQLDQPIVFFGGTALARTWLPNPSTGGRLSEDIDLYTAERKKVADVLQELPRLLRREFPGARWDPSPADVPATASRYGFSS
ncbi:nucleotidyl transferase AbiEii/AbiGii toxin family protein [Amycolatopsis keratiniphila]|uniref:nucleotidyl transferase AbiEii/AbiGii toxin family protein n=1 Tax=Amycolatopsis keratiniphila TaxID=129921 RepID=UPI000907A48E|nr:nucleotidyl transferase AbiEii/AbiGii toxin family protein [Amycolatopsis keratiniphila]OLZ56147.1 hypothetical protein BS330_18705 [Amycolatopsis keratiniphila subsp. nogabecina]